MKQKKLYDYFFQKAIKNHVPVSVMIELLTKCNLRCQHCYLPKHDKSGFSSDKMIKLIMDLHDLGVVNISFTGGEIFLRDDLFELITLARNLYMRVYLLSNGTLLNEEKVKKLADLYISEFSTTVFSMRKDVHDAITRKTGSWDMVMKNLELLKNYNIRVKVKTPLLNSNAPYYKEIQEYCEINKFEFLTSPLILPKIDGDDSPKALRVNNNFSSLIRELQKSNPRVQQNKHDFPCTALQFSFAIECEGNVNPCNSFIYPVGNVYQDNISDIWYHSKKLNYVQSIRNRDLNQCQECKYQKECRRCPALAFENTGNLLGCDRYSKKEAQILCSNVDR